MKKSEMFTRLVENGFDFLNKAITEIMSDPKYSIIHFYAGLELLLKARLMHEHWSLVINRRQELDWQKFLIGDFQSVSLDESAILLNKVIQSGLSQVEISSFRTVRNHRNKIIHFFHEATSDEENKKLVEEIVKEQLKAWYYLHKLLTIKWKEVFTDWQSTIVVLDSSLRKLHEYLQVKFDDLKEKIKTEKKNGALIQKCPSCGFASQLHDQETKKIYRSNCLVCELVEKNLRIGCVNCSKIVIFRDEGFADCPSCDKAYEPSDLASLMIDSFGSYNFYVDGDELHIGNCSNCDGFQTVIKTEDNDWVCMSCFEEFDELNYCDWCNELNTGDMEQSYAFGCNHCDGKIGHLKDD